MSLNLASNHLNNNQPSPVYSNNKYSSELKIKSNTMNRNEYSVYQNQEYDNDDFLPITSFNYNTIDTGNSFFNCHEFVPNTYEDGQKVDKLIVFFHGDLHGNLIKKDNEGNIYSTEGGMRTIADWQNTGLEYPNAIIITPEITTGHWVNATHLKSEYIIDPLDEFITTTAEKYGVETGDIVLMGYSGGSYITTKLVEKRKNEGAPKFGAEVLISPYPLVDANPNASKEIFNGENVITYTERATEYSVGNTISINNEHKFVCDDAFLLDKNNNHKSDLFEWVFNSENKEEPVPSISSEKQLNSFTPGTYSEREITFAQRGKTHTYTVPTYTNSHGYTFNLYDQFDSKWGLIPEIGIACNTFSSTVISSAFNPNVNPYTFGGKGWEDGNTNINNFRNFPNDSVWSVTEGKSTCTIYGADSVSDNTFNQEKYNKSESPYVHCDSKEELINNIKSELNNGHPIVIRTSNTGGVGDGKSVTGGDHYMALIDYNPETNQVFVGNAYGGIGYGSYGWFDFDTITNKPMTVYAYNLENA